MLSIMNVVLFLLGIAGQCHSAQQSYEFTKHELSQGKSLLSIPYSSVNEIVLSDNDVLSVSLPWGGFPYFSGIYSSAYISSNGMVTFGDDISTTTTDASDNRIYAKFPQSNQRDFDDDVIYNVVLDRNTKASDVKLLSANIKHRHLDRNDLDFSVHVLTQLNHLRMLSVKNPSKKALAYLQNHPHVVSVELDSEVEVYGDADMTLSHLSNIRTTRPFSSPSTGDNRLLKSNPYSWGLDRCDQSDLPLDEATYISPIYAHKGQGVDVYVVDSGLMTSHVEFGDIPGYPREVKNVWDAYIPYPTKPDTDNDNNGESNL